MRLTPCIVSVLLLVLPGSALSEPSLLGTWQSNAELTLKSMESVRDLTPENREAWGRVFGNIEFSFSEDVAVIDLGVPGMEEGISTSYRVVSSGPDHIIVELGDPEDPLETIEFFYVDSCMKRRLVGYLFEGMYEYFCKAE